MVWDEREIEVSRICGDDLTQQTSPHCSHEPEQKTSFRKRGYYKTSIDLSPAERSTLLQLCESLSYESVFKEVGGVQDPMRSQAVLVRDWITEPIFIAVEFALYRASPLYEVKEAVALRSELNGSVQEIHRDMALEDVKSATSSTGLPPVGVIVALMQDTKVRVYDGCFGDVLEVDLVRSRDVSIAVGECIVFRADLAHCGLGYDHTNVRVHFAVGIEGSQWVSNETHPVIIKTYDCECGSSFGTQKKLTQHLGWCKSHGDRTRVEKVRKRCNEFNRLGGRCTVCGKFYQLRSSLRKHKLSHRSTPGLTSASL